MIEFRPIKTSQTNIIYTAPEGMENCGELPAQKIEYGIKTTWKVHSEEARKKFLETGEIELCIYSNVIPPLSLTIKEK